MIPLAIPLSWYQLAHERARFAVAIAAVSFAVILMFMEFGFQSALFSSATLLHEHLSGELFIVDARSTALANMKQYSRRILYQARAQDEVQSVGALYIGFASSITPHQENSSRRILVVGTSPADDLIGLPEVTAQRGALSRRDNVLFDRASRKEIGPIADDWRLGRHPSLDMGKATLRVSGLFKMGASFSADGNAIVSDDTFRHIFPGRCAGAVDIGVVRLRANAPLQTVQKVLQSQLGPDVRVLTKNQFVQAEQNYWRQTTAIGFIFSIGVALGLVVGAAVVYQILYANVNEHLSEYATLKAIGYQQAALSEMVLEQAIILSCAGFLPGLAVSLKLYEMTRDVTGLPMNMSVSTAAFVVALVTVMCCVSAMLAAERLRKADPASVF